MWLIRDGSNTVSFTNISLHSPIERHATVGALNVGWFLTQLTNSHDSLGICQRINRCHLLLFHLLVCTEQFTVATDESAANLKQIFAKHKMYTHVVIATAMENIYFLFIFV